MQQLDLFNKSLYESRRNNVLKKHKDYVTCKSCVKDFDPFVCTFVVCTFGEAYRAMYAQTLEPINCPKCGRRLAYMSLDRHNPFTVVVDGRFF